MGTSDGTVVGATKILDHGSDTDRWTMVLVAEGYRSSELAQFHTDAQNFVNTLVATAPFNTLQAAINVYRVRAGTPAEAVRAAGGRALPGLGEAATLLETAAGPTLQVASPRFLVTLLVQGRSPPDDAWRVAARAALARLPR